MKIHICKFHQCCRFLYHCMWKQDHKILWREEMSVINKVILYQSHSELSLVVQHTPFTFRSAQI
jgi:hypothetical protein